MSPLTGATIGYHRIRSLDVTGGFLNGLSIRFANHLNCVIGGRGSGKTTLVQLLRFAFFGRSDAGLGLDRLVESNLQTGQLRVVVETKDGATYTIERTATGDPSITDATGKSTTFDLATANVFSVDVYGQAEIEQLATHPKDQIKLLDRFAADEIRGLDEQIDALVRSLRANARELGDLERQEATRDGVMVERASVEERLRALPEPSGTEAAAIQREVTLKAERDLVVRVFARLEQRIENQRSALAGAAEPLVDLVANFPGAALQGVNGDALREFKATVDAARERIRRAADDASSAVEGLLHARKRAWAVLAPRLEEQDQVYRKVMVHQARDRGRAEERLALRRRLDELDERLLEIRNRESVLSRLRSERSALRRELSELRDRRAATRERVAAELTRALGPEIQVALNRGQDSTAFQALLNQALKGSGRPYQDMTRAVGARIAPADFARMVQAGQNHELATHLDVKPARVELLVQALRGTDALYDLEIAEVEDVPSIALQVGGQYKTSERLSTGQRCTTILPILLLDSGRPLLIDQPEDNLDNEYIFTHVVPQIERVKGRRQLIFATHNPNIPVLGDAGNVVVLKSSGDSSKVVGQGTVDEVRQHVETILEGGREAFQARLAKYGR